LAATSSGGPAGAVLEMARVTAFTALTALTGDVAVVVDVLSNSCCARWITQADDSCPMPAELVPPSADHALAVLSRGVVGHGPDEVRTTNPAGGPADETLVIAEPVEICLARTGGPAVTPTDGRRTSILDTGGVRTPDAALPNVCEVTRTITSLPRRDCTRPEGAEADNALGVSVPAATQATGAVGAAAGLMARGVSVVTVCARAGVDDWCGVVTVAARIGVEDWCCTASVPARIGVEDWCGVAVVPRSTGVEDCRGVVRVPTGTGVTDWRGVVIVPTGTGVADCRGVASVPTGTGVADWLGVASICVSAGVEDWFEAASVFVRRGVAGWVATPDGKICTALGGLAMTVSGLSWPTCFNPLLVAAWRTT